MGDHLPRRPGPAPAFDPITTPLPRRRMLALMGAGTTLAATGGLGTFLAACKAPPVTVQLDVDPGKLVVGTPREVLFPLPVGDGTIDASTWLVKQASGDLVAFDPRCTHGLCRYRWSEASARFVCGCHDGHFALDGAVLSGPPPRPLGQFPIREAAGVIEVDVPGDFETPKESLPA
jgi:Rieske Fe-S protein